MKFAVRNKRLILVISEDDQNVLDNLGGLLINKKILEIPNDEVMIVTEKAFDRLKDQLNNKGMDIEIMTLI